MPVEPIFFHFSTVLFKSDSSEEQVSSVMDHTPGRNSKVLSFKQKAKNSTNVTSLPTVFAITPTYARDTQRVDLTSICHTLMHVPDLVWIVVEDSHVKTKLVTNLLTRCKLVSIVHMNIKVIIVLYMSVAWSIGI